MYDPTTGRTNGTTPTFFATITIRPAKIVDRPHRHVSAAINYYFQGSGYTPSCAAACRSIRSHQE